MSLPITALYAGLLALLFVFLSIRVIGARREAGVPIGDGSNPLLLRRMRVHANFAEYVPMALVLMALSESLDTAEPLLHGIGVVLLAGRCVHAYGVSQPNEMIGLRIIGMAATFTAIIGLAFACIVGSQLQ